MRLYVGFNGFKVKFCGDWIRVRECRERERGGRSESSVLREKRE
jgi:hypothetical protein